MSGNGSIHGNVFAPGPALKMPGETLGLELDPDAEWAPEPWWEPVLHRAAGHAASAIWFVGGSIRKSAVLIDRTADGIDRVGHAVLEAACRASDRYYAGR